PVVLAAGAVDGDRGEAAEGLARDERVVVVQLEPVAVTDQDHVIQAIARGGRERQGTREPTVLQALDAQWAGQGAGTRARAAPGGRAKYHCSSPHCQSQVQTPRTAGT